MAIYVFRNSDGALISYCPADTDPVASADVLTAKGFSALTGAPPLDATHTWDTVSRNVIAVAIPAATVSYFAFIQAFTAAELAAIRASLDTNVAKFLFSIASSPQIDLSDARMNAALTYLVSHGLLTAARASAIAATVS